MTPDEAVSDEVVAQEVAAHGRTWYHTMELRPGVVTMGEFDLRTVPSRLPWIDVAGKRCLDVGTYDGFWAFEMERRGASEVVAVDVDDQWEYDWPEILSPRLRGELPERYREGEGPTGRRFALAKRALGSSVERHNCSIYALDPDDLGMFDVVFCSSLLLHLRDPVAALAALRSVCRGHLMTNEPIDLTLSALHPRKAVARFDGKGQQLHWWLPNTTTQQRMLESAGFSVVKAARPVIMPFRERRSRAHWRTRLKDYGNTVVTGMRTQGVLQRPLLAQPII